MTPADAAQDAAYMRRALDLARRGWGQTAPNPMVGAVVVRDGQVIAEGWHARYGGPHAEAAALAALPKKGARDADVYVTLEPCAHHGKTPPCTDALIKAKVRRVIVAVRDPNPVAAGGIEALQAAGIEVTVGVETAAAEDLNAPFLFAARRQDRPFITLKLALSAEGAVAPAGGARQQWLTGAEARRHVHHLRAGADAILVGIGTVLADNPALTVRDAPEPRVPPKRLVLDREARLPLTSQLVRTARELPVAVLAERPDPQRLAALTAAGVEVSVADGLAAHLAALRARGVRHLFAEPGDRLATALIEGNFVDRLVIFRTPVPLGADALAGVGKVLPPAEGDAAWSVLHEERLGTDWLTVYASASR
ncbi:MAG: bifunctional diaminohydroxyphosphoribosylaminopyrimidine deaminase/5-amino-6-(5-phosphoribosylamino)uracil reductase RibD [Gemmatimonadaceae bacterium]|nr:bifunctional diaminohydroxyphosphoribosylaminopyrimidine deaminase/5-amino-6-(5-phosphoribosylamino)uracil reductase RibD [Gemmatimonadaceae bacterium]MCW5824992.1 bifunctional diaminohydroxyphosphoribosylaminopyrimidine deaminase/5-amino-6-(5-phosphoribosylamino)uracil reductase RibD [Gemmatimonadaceae bacterium]